MHLSIKDALKKNKCRSFCQTVKQENFVSDFPGASAHLCRFISVYNNNNHTEGMQIQA